MKKLIKVLVLPVMSVIALGGCSQNFDENKEIKIYTRDTSSGTRDGFFTGIGFEEAVKDDTVLKEGKIRVDSNGDMISAIENDLYGIGYISLSSLTEKLNGIAYEGTEPTEENVINKKYQLTRNFNYCIRAEYNNAENKEIVLAFISYMNTVEGEATIKQHGGIVNTVATQSWDEIKEKYAIASQDNSSLTITVGGSTSVQSIVSNLLLEFSKKCGNFKYIYNPTGSSDAYKRTNGSEKDGANACDLAFASREFKDSESMSDELKGMMCIDAIVVVTNKNNKTLQNVNKATLKSIYDGTIQTWKEVK
jgi:phosphate transport system substrate-binding protein